MPWANGSEVRGRQAAVWMQRGRDVSSRPPALPVIPPELLVEPSPPAFVVQPRCQTQGQGTKLSSAKGLTDFSHGSRTWVLSPTR